MKDKSAVFRLWLIAVCVVSIAACGDDHLQDEVHALRAELDDTRQVVQRLQAQHQVPEYRFILFNVSDQIQEKTFQPILISRAELNVEGGETAPAPLYLDVELKVELPENGPVLTSRQIFYVNEGQTKVHMEHILPEHGLKLEELSVSLTPLNWYRGERISTDQVQVDPNPR